MTMPPIHPYLAVGLITVLIVGLAVLLWSEAKHK